MKYILALAACLFLMSPHANAEGKLDTFGVHIGSKHSNYNQQWNDSNPGVYGVFGVEGLSREPGSWLNGRYVLGTYLNSINKQSGYVGRVFEYPLTNRLSAGLVVGVITGYERPVLPMVVPSVSFRMTDSIHARLSVAPKAAKNGATALHLSIEYKF